MPEVETKELQEIVEEIRHEQEREHARETWIRWVSLSTSVLAVLASISSLKSELLVNKALIKKNEAVLKQNQASDMWAYFQAKSMKRNGVTQTADILSAHPATAKLAAKYRGAAGRYQRESDEIEVKAYRLEAERDKKNKESQQLLDEHHHFAYCVTLTQVAIALSAIAAMTKLKPVWFLSMAIGLVGFGFFLGIVPAGH